MIVASLLELINRTIELIRRQEEVRRSLFEDVVQPTFAAFQALHSDYISSLRRYHDLLQVSEGASDEQAIMETIANDALLTSHLRKDVAALSAQSIDGCCEAFLNAIRRYLRFLTDEHEYFVDSEFEADDGDFEVARYVPRYENIVRAVLVSDLRSLARIEVSASHRGTLARLLLQQIAKRLQSLHSDVTHTYVGLRDDLLRTG